MILEIYYYIIKKKIEDLVNNKSINKIYLGFFYKFFNFIIGFN